MELSEMTKEERSLLLYFETAAGSCPRLCEFIQGNWPRPAGETSKWRQYGNPLCRFVS